jgi:hypothetical protein
MDRATDPPAERADTIWAAPRDERPSGEALFAADRQRRAREAVTALVAAILRRQGERP